MKILLLSPPSIYTENVVRDAIYGCWCKGKRIAGAKTPPHPLLLLGAILKNEGHYVRVIDAQAEKIENLDELISNFDVVVILTSVMTFDEDAVVLEHLKKCNSELTSIVFGAHPTFMPELCLQKEGVDIIVQGEGDFAIRDLVNTLNKKDSSWQNTKGIGFRRNGAIQINEPYPQIENLDELPFVDWSLLPKNNLYFNPLVRRYPYVTDLTTRGCPGRCTFCMDPVFYGRKTRARSVKNVIEGFKRYLSLGYKEIYLRDEMFSFFRERNRQICTEMIRNKMDLTWLCSAKIGTVDKEDLKLMKEAGCHTIKFGVESGVQEILNNVKKGITLKQTRQTFKWVHETGIDTHAHLMLGLPGETEKTIRKTLSFVKEINPTTMTIAIVTPFPGTPLFEIAAEKYPEIKRGYNLNMGILHTKAFLTDAFCEVPAKELEKWIRKFYVSFYLRPTYILQWLKRIKNFADLKRVVKAGINIFDFSLKGG